MATAISTLLGELGECGALKDADIPNVAGLSLAMVAVWTSGASLPRPEIQRLITNLRYVVDRLAEFYGPDEVRVWLYANHHLLGGERPVDLIDARRAGQVVAVIDGVDAVAYA